VSRLERSGERWRVVLEAGKVIEADVVVASTPAFVTATLVEEESRALATTLRKIPFAGIAVVGLGYRRAQVGHPLDGFGLLIPRAEQRHTLGVLFTSSTFPDRAPAGHVLLRAMIGGVTNPEAVEWSEERLLGVVREEIHPLLAIEGLPRWTRVFRYRRGIAQYNVGHREILGSIRRELRRLPGLFLTGTSYEGIAVNSACQAAPRLAQAIVDAQVRRATPEQLF